MLFSGHFCSLSSSCLENFHTNYLSIPAKGLNAIFPAHRFPAKLGGQHYSRVEVGFQQLQSMSKTRRKDESGKLARRCHRNPFVHFPDSRGLNALAETGLFSRWHGWYPALKIMHRQTQSPPASSTQPTSSSFAALMGRRVE